MRNLILVLFLILLAACSSAPAPTPGPPTLTPTLTLPPWPTLTPWSTKTPRPTRTPTPTPHACWSSGGQLIEDLVPSNQMPDPIIVSIYLPPCYHQLPVSDYPALYLFHGQGFDQDQWTRLGITSLADDQITAGQAPPFLIVMPFIEDWDGPVQSFFGQVVIEELIPYIESHYRARPNRQDRQVGGISRGGSWAINLGLSEWQTFAAFGGHSAPVFYDDAPYIPYWLKEIPEEQMPAIYIDFAKSDQSIIRRSAREFLALLVEGNIPYTFSTGPGSHIESYWASQMENYFNFYISNMGIIE